MNYENFLKSKVVVAEKFNYIYTLNDPDTLEIRYIGKTDDLNRRLVRHCNEKGKTHRIFWVQSLIAKGKRPVIMILQKLNSTDNWQQHEIRWIAYGRAKGWRLTNKTDGGDGVVNLTGDSLERLRKAWVGRKHSPESIIRIGLASKGRVKTEAMKQVMKDKMAGRKITWAAKLKKLSVLDCENIAWCYDGTVASKKKLADDFKVHFKTIEQVVNGTYFNNITAGPWA